MIFDFSTKNVNMKYKLENLILPSSFLSSVGRKKTLKSELHVIFHFVPNLVYEPRKKNKAIQQDDLKTKQNSSIRKTGKPFSGAKLFCYLQHGTKYALITTLLFYV